MYVFIQKFILCFHLFPCLMTKAFHIPRDSTVEREPRNLSQIVREMKHESVTGASKIDTEEANSMFGFSCGANYKP